MADEARAERMEWLAGQFDRGRRQLDDLFAGVSTRRGSDAIWTGGAADRFTGSLRPVRSDVDKLPDGFQRTARNLREAAERMRAEG
jgi:uncharacterized protein YukE